MHGARCHCKLYIIPDGFSGEVIGNVRHSPEGCQPARRTFEIRIKLPTGNAVVYTQEAESAQAALLQFKDRVRWRGKHNTNRGDAAIVAVIPVW